MKYHMRKATREIKDAAAIEDILARGKFATLALCRKDEPYVVTMNYGYDRGGRALYFHCAKEGLKTDFVRENPNAAPRSSRTSATSMAPASIIFAPPSCAGESSSPRKLKNKRRLDCMIRHLEE